MNHLRLPLGLVSMALSDPARWALKRSVWWVLLVFTGTAAGLMMIPGYEIGRLLLAENDMAASLVVDGIPELGEGPNGVLAGEDRQPAHAGTSTVASQVGGGTGSLCLRRLSR